MPLLMKLKFTGKIEGLFLRPSRAGGFEKAPTGAIRLGLDGPEGDCHTGLTRKSDSRTTALYQRGLDIRNVRQLTLLSREELQEIADALGIMWVDPSWLGANLVLSGVPDFTMLPPSTRLQFPSGATIVVDMENYPCSQIAEVIGRHHPEVERQVVKKAMHKRGVTAWVEREGDVKMGDAVALFIPPQRIYSHGT
jgi:hypothetical protein